MSMNMSIHDRELPADYIYIHMNGDYVLCTYYVLDYFD